jgi:hypothetical protein
MPENVRLSDLTPRARNRLKEELRAEVMVEERASLERYLLYWRGRAAEADRIIDSRQGVMIRANFRKALACLHRITVHPNMHARCLNLSKDWKTSSSSRTRRCSTIRCLIYGRRIDG